MLIKRKPLILGALLLSTFRVFFLPVSSQAQSSSTGKIGVLNVFTAIAESAEGKQALGDFQKKVDAKKEELQKKNNEIEELQKQLQSQSRTLNDDSRATLARNIDVKTTELRRAQEDAEKEFGQMQNEILQRIGSKLAPVVQQYAKEQNFALIVDSSNQSNQLVYFDPAIEITQDIVKRFDSSPSVPVSGGTRQAPSQPKTPPAQPKALPAQPKTSPPPPKP